MKRKHLNGNIELLLQLPERKKNEKLFLPIMT